MGRRPTPLSAPKDGGTVVRQVTVGSAQPAASTSESLSVSEIYEQAYEGVVEITSLSSQSSPLGGEQQAQGQGSGFVFDVDGHIVTNDHVVEGAEEVSVRFWDGSTYDATVVGTDPSTDLAVIKVDAPASILTRSSSATPPSSASARSVVALGSPFGLEGTATSGIVSALNREMTQNNFTISNSIQTDAAINHGNSGGPLLNTAARSSASTRRSRASRRQRRHRLRHPVEHGLLDRPADRLQRSVEHAYLGAGVASLSQSVADELGVPAGVMVTEVGRGRRRPSRSSRGHRLRDGRRPELPDRRRRHHRGGRHRDRGRRRSPERHRRQAPADTVSITYTRAGESTTVQVSLGTRPS